MAKGTGSGKSIGGLLFGLFFLLGGLVAGYFSVLKPLGQTALAMAWQPVPAQMSELQLKFNKDSASKVVGRYEYQYAGHTYQSERISFYAGYDNVGDYWEQLYRHLQRQQETGQVTAWVNPHQQDEAVLDRSVRVPMLVFGGVFMLLFGGIGAGIMVWSWRADRRSEQEQRLLAGEHSALPAGIASNERHSGWLLYGIGATFILITSPAWWALPDELGKGNHGILAVLIFPLIGAGLVLAGWLSFRGYKRIGPTPFFPDPLPGYAGGQVGGYFELDGRSPVSRLRCRLECVHVYSRGSGKSRRTVRDILWQEERLAIPEHDRIYMQFEVPESLPASGAPGYRGSILWTLTCEGELRVPQPNSDTKLRLPLSRSWTIPVAAGAGRAQWQAPNSVQQQEQRQRRQQAAESATRQIAARQQGDTLQLHSAAARNAGTSVLFMLMGLLFAGIGIFMLQVARDDGGMLWLFPLLFTPMGLLVLWLGVSSLGRSLEADIRPGQVRMVRRFMGRPLYQRQAQLRSPEQLQVELTMTANMNGKVTEYFRVVATDEQRKLVLAESIAGREAAEQIRQNIIAVACQDLTAELVI